MEWLWPFAQVTALARHVHGLLAVLDDMEVWQVAAALGVHEPTPSPTPAVRSGRGRGESAVARRMRAARGEAPPPEPPTDPAIAAWAAEFAVRE